MIFFLKMEETLVFIDEGFLSKVSKYLGKGLYIKFDKIKLAKNLAKKSGLFCDKIFFYTAPPFQSPKPTSSESAMYRKYKKFILKLSKSKEILIREGRCQRLKQNNTYIYKQKGVDSLMVMDMISATYENKNISKIIMIASDSDFVPVINHLKEKRMDTLLFTYFQKKRNTNFSRSNHLLKSVSKYIQLTKQDFEDAKLK